MPSAARSGATSTLDARGYGVLPEPQHVALTADDMEFGSGWRVVTTAGLGRDDDLAEILRDYLADWHGITLTTAGHSDRTVVLELTTEEIQSRVATDQDASAISDQSYRLRIALHQIRITSTTRNGLLYGIATLVQLITPQHGRFWLPVGVISDWPDVGRRYILWDDSEHLDRCDSLKAAIRQAAIYKINGLVLKLDAHFCYRSAPEIVAPHALTPEQLQNLTDYGLRHGVQVIPYLDAPGHLAWLLKHPEYADLREFPDCNYELCTTDPRAYQVLEGLFDDLLAANQGVDYFVLSTDEPYYVGLGRSRGRAAELGSVGRLEAEFITRTATYLREHGRTVQIWGEYPIERNDISMLPPFLINGVNAGPKYDADYARQGLRQLIYVSIQAELPNFPDYYPLPHGMMVNPIDSHCALDTIYHDIRDSSVRRQDNLAGIFVAAWADVGLHPETFWLGFSCAAAWAWHPGSPPPAEAVERFGRLFYGHRTENVAALYQGMSSQALFFQSSWDRHETCARPPLFGDSYEIYDPPKPANDQTLSLPDLPDLPVGSLTVQGDQWRRDNRRRLQLARAFAGKNEELAELLHGATAQADRNGYNLRVLSSLILLFGQNLQLLQDLGRIDVELRNAESHAADPSPHEAVAALDLALDLCRSIRRQRNDTLNRVVGVWSASMHLKTPSANGRRLLHVLDDVKDHLPDRTPDMSYLIHRQLLLPFDDWFDRLLTVRNDYAEQHHGSPRQSSLNWAGYNLNHPGSRHLAPVENA